MLFKIPFSTLYTFIIIPSYLFKIVEESPQLEQQKIPTESYYCRDIKKTASFA
nr:MAG TPA: hypothetical protein [Caudoviricetes sp.]